VHTVRRPTFILCAFEPASNIDIKVDLLLRTVGPIPVQGNTCRSQKSQESFKLLLDLLWSQKIHLYLLGEDIAMPISMCYVLGKIIIDMRFCSKVI
jgi:hypothetical protein